MAARTLEEANADIAFLLQRAEAAGSINFTNERWTGMSSNALVAFAYGGEQTAWPSDRSDYAACVRTYLRLPRHRQTPEVRAALKRAREVYLANYPESRFPAGRAAARAAWEARQAEFNKRRKRRTRA